MGQMQRCEQGHFYDATRHRRCPACGIPGLDIGTTVPAIGMNDPETGGIKAKRRGRHDSPAPDSDDVTQRLDPEQHSDAPTIAYWHRPNKGDTAGAAGADDVMDPVVGWLVAIDGPVKGRDYRIYSEGNEIGRANHFRVVIKGDDSIAQRDAHAIVTYDPRSEDAAYYLQPGGRHLLWLTHHGSQAREVVLTPTRLQAYDVIDLGKTRLLFVPLCNDRFRWHLDDGVEEQTSS